MAQRKLSKPVAASVSATGNSPDRASTARTKRGAERRAAILAAALEEFSARGFATARLDDVARRAGVAKGTIYLYFADKETLFQELLRTELGPVVEAVTQLSHADIRLRDSAGQLIEVFAREIFETRRKDVIRLVIHRTRDRDGTCNATPRRGSRRTQVGCAGAVSAVAGRARRGCDHLERVV
ncbi:MAG: TetR/AcrR family transcriptional regulator [Rhizobiales bacterium]|nr:TetR/AcrR family transcriptional regulator [Hyphomicrobiales bacterium]